MLKRFVFALGMLCVAQGAWATWAVGDTPPDFTCTDWNGNSWNLYSHRGKVVMINFGATW
jgi:cytochrome oxidase Cu insertion factor (SCO1/SenC/PrrC family)